MPLSSLVLGSSCGDLGSFREPFQARRDEAIGTRDIRVSASGLELPPGRVSVEGSRPGDSGYRDVDGADNGDLQSAGEQSDKARPSLLTRDWRLAYLRCAVSVSSIDWARISNSARVISRYPRRSDSPVLLMSSRGTPGVMGTSPRTSVRV